MKQVIRSVLSPLWSLFFLMLGGGFFITFISVRMKNEGFTEMAIGVVHACYYAGLLLGAARTEKLLRRVGHIRAFSAFASIHTATILVQGFESDPYAWAMLRFIAGFCIAAMYVVIESWLLAKSTVITRGRILGIYMFCLYFAQAIGQFIMNFIDISVPEPFLIAAFMSAIAVVPVAMTYFPSPEVEQDAPEKVMHFFYISPFGTMGCLISGIILGVIYSFTPNFAQEKGISVSLLVSSTIVGGALLQWPMGKLSDVFDRRHVLIVVSFAVIIPSVMMVFLSSHGAWELAAAFLLGGLAFTLYPLSITQVCDRVDPEDITTVTGVLLLAYGIGASVGPLIAPLFMIPFGIDALYWFIGGTGLILGTFGCISIFLKKAVPMKDQGEYMPLPRITSVAYELDPRAPGEEED